MNAIEVQGLTKHFGDIVALDDLNLSVPHGSIFGFLGPNGAGKTTTLRIMTGLAHATAGQIEIEGVRVGSGQRPPIGYLPDTPSFYHWMTAREFLRYISRLHDLENPPIDAVLERVGLAQAAKRRIGGFSRGMKQRLGVAQALIPQPAVLLMDEPVSALDPAGRKEVLDIMAHLRGDLTVFFSTHILGDADRICDNIGIIDHGKLVLEAPRDDLLARFARPLFEIDIAPEAGPQLKALAERLKPLPWVERTSYEGARLQVAVRDVNVARRELLLMLSELPVLRFEMVGTTLEDVFLRLTENHAHQEENES
jgi:ABC-2 type transport system ATP-binding protein